MNISEFIYTIVLKPRPLKKLANAILKLITPEYCTLDGAQIFLNPDDPVVSGALTLGVYEKGEISFFKSVISPDMIFVDIGANVGLYTAIALTHMKYPGKIVAFEPDPMSVEYLNKTINANIVKNQAPYVKHHQVALSNTKKNIPFYKNPDNKGDNRLYSDPLCPDVITVYSNTLDSLLSEDGIQSVNLIKIDVQGAEFKVMKGAMSTLKNSKDCIIITEFWPYGLSNCGSSPEEYISLLKDSGFTLFLLVGKKITPIKDYNSLIKNCSGRNYRNLVGLKGIYKDEFST